MAWKAESPTPELRYSKPPKVKRLISIRPQGKGGALPPLLEW